MKKTKFYIYGFFGEKKPQARQVNGYFEYIDGNVLEFLPQVRTEIDKDRFKKVKEIIQAAYKAG